MSCKISLVFLLILISSAQAEEITVRFGLGLLDGGRTAQIKNAALRVSEYGPYRGTASATEIGGWTDTGRVNGRKGALYISQQIGFRPQSENVYFKAFVGPCLQSSTDSMLGGVLQLKSDFGLGFQDDASVVGLTYSHISSAGLFAPNKGRDFITFEAGIRW